MKQIIFFRNPIRIWIFLVSILLTFNANAVTTGTTNGTYDFGSLGVSDGGGSGFKIQGDKFKVSNTFLSGGTTIYLNSTSSASVVIKAEGGSTMKMATVEDLAVGDYGSGLMLTQFNITLKNYSGAIIATHSLSGNQSVTHADMLISSLSFSTGWPAGGYDNVSEIDISYTLSSSTSNFEFRSIKLSNITATLTVAPTVTTQAVSSITATTATGNGTVTATGGADITERGVYYSTTNGFADGAGTKVSTTGTWSTTGAFTQAITGLTAGTTYYVKAFATNSAGTSYGAQESFTTTAPSNTAPTASSFSTSSGPYTNNVYTFSTSDFGYSDGDSDALDHVRVTAVPGSGTLYVDANSNDSYDSGEELANNDQISKANLDAGNLQFYTTSASSTSFTFDVNDGTDYSASTYTATVSVSDLATTTYSGTGNWTTNSSNWNPGIPGSTTDVTILSGTITVDADIECADLTINTGAVVSVDPGNVLTVTGTLTNSAGTGGLLFQSDATGTGMLMNNSTGVQATFEQYLVKDQWHYMGLPVVNINDANDVYHACYLYTIREDSVNWYDTTWVNLSAGDHMDALRGYATIYTRLGANDTTITFSGTLNTGTVDTVFYSQMYGWNFISNPYPTTLDWDASGGKSTTNTNNAIYLWNPTLEAYGSYVNGASTNGQTRYIPPMQGFFIQVNQVNSSLSFNDNAKVAQKVAFKNATVEPQIRLAVTDDDMNYDEMLLRVKNNSTTEFDSNYDAAKFKALRSKQPLIWSVVNDKEYSINSIPEITENSLIPIEVLVKTSGVQKLVLKELTNYEYSYPIVLLDEHGNLLKDLQQEDYSFSADAGETVTLNLAFKVATVDLKENAGAEFSVFSQGKNLVINDLKNIPSTVNVVNMNGQVIFNEDVSSDCITIPISQQGIYIVTVGNKNQESSIKKTIVSF